MKKYIKNLSFNTRYNFGKYQRYFQIPSLISIQKESYSNLLQENTFFFLRRKIGLQNIFKSIFPVSNYKKSYNIEFLNYTIIPSPYTIYQCKDKGLVYSSSLRVKLRLLSNYLKKNNNVLQKKKINK